MVEELETRSRDEVPEAIAKYLQDMSEDDDLRHIRTVSYQLNQNTTSEEGLVEVKDDKRKEEYLVRLSEF